MWFNLLQTVEAGKPSWNKAQWRNYCQFNIEAAEARRNAGGSEPSASEWATFQAECGPLSSVIIHGIPGPIGGPITLSNGYVGVPQNEVCDSTNGKVCCDTAANTCSDSDRKLLVAGDLDCAQPGYQCVANGDMCTSENNKDCCDKSLSACTVTANICDTSANKECCDKTVNSCTPTANVCDVSSNKECCDKSIGACTVTANICDTSANKECCDKTTNSCTSSANVCDVSQNKECVSSCASPMTNGCVPPSCMPGQFYYPTGGGSSCQSCPQGTYGVSTIAIGVAASVTVNYCLPCPAGTYGTATGTTSSMDGCNKCPVGTTTPVVDISSPTYATSQSSCVSCSPGTYWESATALCKPCPAGKYSTGTLTDMCSSCSDLGAPGRYYYQPHTGQASCLPCKSMDEGTGNAICGTHACSTSTTLCSGQADGLDCGC